MPAPATTSVTDSPWFWIYLFAAGGLIALVLMGPRFTARQSQIERNTEGRLRAAQNVAGEAVTPQEGASRETAIRLQPLIIVLSCVVVVAGGMVGWQLRRRRRATFSVQPPPGDRSP